MDNRVALAKNRASGPVLTDNVREDAANRVRRKVKLVVGRGQITVPINIALPEPAGNAYANPASGNAAKSSSAGTRVRDIAMNLVFLASLASQSA